MPPNGGKMKELSVILKTLKTALKQFLLITSTLKTLSFKFYGFCFLKIFKKIKKIPFKSMGFIQIKTIKIKQLNPIFQSLKKFFKDYHSFLIK